MNNARDTIYIFIDASGSMYEMGKRFVIRYLYRLIKVLPEIEPKKYGLINFLFYNWGETPNKIELIEDVPISAHGTSRLMDIVHFFEDNTTLDTSTKKILLLSDGHVDFDDYKQFEKSKNDTFYIQTVAIGEDANTNKLKKLSSTHTVYLAENIIVAIDQLLYAKNADVEHIFSFDDIPHCDLTESEDILEEEDDWDA